MDKKKKQSYLKFTGETEMVLFASKIIVPFTAGSLLLVLKHKRTSSLKIKTLKARSEKKRATFTHLYSIFPVVGSKITHRSFHFLS